MIIQFFSALQKKGNQKKKELSSPQSSMLQIKHSIHWEKPLELKAELQSVPELSKSMLPKLVSDYTFEQAKIRDNADPEYTAVAIIIAAAALIGGSAAISPKRRNKDWKLKPVLWAMIVGSPSKMKTPSLLVGVNLIKHAIKEVIEPENQRLELGFKATERTHKAQISKLEKDAEKHVQEGNEKAAKQIFTQIEQLTQPQPQYRRPLINDATVEALIKRIQSNPLGVLLYRDELYGWMASLDKQDKAQERSFCNEAFNGDGVYEVERVGRGNLKLKNPTLFVLGNIQPDRLKTLVSSRESGQSNDGLFERFQLMVYPDRDKKSYVDVTPDYSLTLRMKKLFIKLAHLSNPQRYSEPLGFDFANDAQDMWDDWAAELINRERQSDDDEQAILGKYGALVAKLALVFHLLIEAEKCDKDTGFQPSDKVTNYALSLAIKWSNFLLQHNRKIRAIGGSKSNGLESATTLKSKLCFLPDDFTIRDLQRKGWKGLKSKNEITDALDILQEYGYVKQYTARTASGKISNKYLIHPEYRNA